ncbi:Nif3-like dinuclear metal center hexameric protein [Oceanobacillus sp. Castelsardo]|uniref:Nif3-like dinuclear metal center hexameric protein n=1 Tax=Oceanobacillus sp. Castelsardo TaxID=1851204 RepID=UPI0008380A57|nr:Nif3-like dinuclear metal center hexameric protein [Oceanobacillus sp. Castelsardo]
MKKHPINNSHVFQLMEKWAPKYLAYDWDNVGLQVGSHNQNVNKIMVTLDVLESVVDEAIRKEVNLIISHHPLLFKPMKQINFDSPQGRIIRKLINHQITVYAAHTNLDAAVGGVNDMLCQSIGIHSTDNLLETSAQRLLKIVVYVPKTHIKEIRNALSDSGAGHIGNYSHCTFQTEGQGTFKPLEGTNPYIGTADQLEFVDEVRMETIVPEEKVNKVISSILKAHPYEEPAYDIYPLKNSVKRFGIGRVGVLPQKLTLEELCKQIKQSLNISGLKVIGDLEKRVEKVAILGGSGEKYIQTAKQKGADVYITGDMTFHTAQDAWQMGLSVIDAGHYIEKIMKKYTVDYLKNELKHHSSIEILMSETNTDPFQFIV